MGKRSSISSRVGDVGGFTGVLVERCFFLIWPIWPFAVASNSGGYFRSYLAIRPGNPLTQNLSCAMDKVESTGDPNEA